MPRRMPSSSVEVRRKHAPPRGPFDELVRGPLARDIGSSRMGEIKREDYPTKLGMGDLQLQEGRRARNAKYATGMLKRGKGGTGKPVRT